MTTASGSVADASRAESVPSGPRFGVAGEQLANRALGERGLDEAQPIAQRRRSSPRVARRAGAAARATACDVSTPIRLAAPIAAASTPSCAAGDSPLVAASQYQSWQVARADERGDLGVAERGHRGVDGGGRFARALAAGAQRAQPIGEATRDRAAVRAHASAPYGSLHGACTATIVSWSRTRASLLEQRVVEQTLAHRGGIARVEDVQAVERELDRVVRLGANDAAPSAGASSRSAATSGANIRIGPSPRTC